MHGGSLRISRSGRVSAAIWMLVVIVASSLSDARAQGPMGKSFGFGIVAGDPTGATFRFWQSRANSIDAVLGNSYLGNPQLHADYLWHFPDALGSRVIGLYCGVGGLIGFGGRGHGEIFKYHGHWWTVEDPDRTVLAAHGVFGFDVIPRRTPLDIFLELDPVLGLSPGFGFDFQLSVGIRFYP